jgi:WD40 repeat protein
VALASLSSNCPVGGDNPREVSVTIGDASRDTARTTFTVACVATSGAIAVTAATSGAEPDPDGYTVRLDNGAPQRLAINGTTLFQALAQGDHTITLEGAAGNCSIGGDNPRTLSVATGGATRDTARTTFTVTCVATTGFVRIRAVTAGAELDPDGYQAFLDRECYDDPYYGRYCNYGWFGNVGVNSAVTPPRVAVGEHTVALDGVAPNCSVSGDNPQTATVPPGDTVEVVMSVTCVLTGSIRAMVTTTGADFDPDGYIVSFAGPAAFAQLNIGTNASVTISQRLAGDYTVTLLGLAGNCTVSGANPVTTTVVGGATADVAFAVTCTPLARLQVTTVTTGIDLDPDGYFAIASGLSGTGATVPANGAVTLGPLIPGDYSVRLDAVAVNCDVSAPNPRTVTLTSGTTTGTAFDVVCAAASQLALVRGRSSLAEIYTIKSNGSGDVRLTNNTAQETDPAWSPDGSKIAVVSYRDGNAEIYVMDANGANVTRLTTNVAVEGDPAWSPDGSKIAFWSTRDGNPEIYVMEANGSNPVRLTNQAGDDLDPTWSPDGSKIAFVSYRDGNAEIYVMNADGQNSARITFNNVDDLQPDWSPDGAKLAVSRSAGCDYYSGFCFYALWIMNADGSQGTPLTGGSADNSPSWSSDGLWIAYGSDVCESYYYYYYGCYYSYSAVRLIRVDGSRGIVDLAYDAFQPAWRR